MFNCWGLNLRALWLARPTKFAHPPRADLNYYQQSTKRAPAMADSPGEPRYARAIDEHAPDPNDDVPDELELNTEIGDVLLLTEIDAPEGWIHCRNEATGEEGLVPETYLELIVPSRADEEEEGEEGPGSPGSAKARHLKPKQRRMATRARTTI